MKIACLSGKGGAGKTLAAVNLAVAGGADTYIDCDVEEPNGRLFLRPQIVTEEPVCTLLPEFDGEKCTGCKECVRFCRFHGLMYIREKPVVFPEVCHSCGGCALVCPEGAVTEISRPVGTLELGRRGSLKVVTGILNTAEASGVPVIRRALDRAEGLTVIDCPPGSACTVMECVMAADHCLLVAEPTTFGLHNLKMVHELAVLLKKPCSVLINKWEGPYEPLEAYCAQTGLPVLARIPYSPAYAGHLARGRVLAEEDGALKDLFRSVLQTLGGGQ